MISDLFLTVVGLVLIRHLILPYKPSHLVIEVPSACHMKQEKRQEKSPYYQYVKCPEGFCLGVSDPVRRQRLVELLYHALNYVILCSEHGENNSHYTYEHAVSAFEFCAV